MRVRVRNPKKKRKEESTGPSNEKSISSCRGCQDPRDHAPGAAPWWRRQGSGAGAGAAAATAAGAFRTRGGAAVGAIPPDLPDWTLSWALGVFPFSLCFFHCPKAVCLFGGFVVSKGQPCVARSGKLRTGIRPRQFRSQQQLRYVCAEQ